MQLPSNSPLSVVKTKTGQSSRQGAKVSAQKKDKKVSTPVKKVNSPAKKTTTSVKNSGSTTKVVSTSAKKVTSSVKETPRVIRHQIQEVAKPVKQLTEEEKIIQAAERYHQQISGKKTETRDEKQTEAPKTTATVKSPVVEPRLDNRPVTTVTESPVTGDLTSSVEKSATEITPRPEFSSYIEHNPGAERDPNVNIFSGNPATYQAEGDTLNFWGYTPVRKDTIPVKTVSSEIPAKPYGFAGKPMTSTAQDWSFFLVLIGWTLFASLRFGFSKYIAQVFHSIFNYTAAARLYREHGYNRNFGVFRLNLIFFLFLPFPVYLIAKDNGFSMTGYSGIELYLMVFVAVNGYFMVKILLYKILGSVFSQRENTGELVFNMMLYNNVLGLVLLPVATIHAMVPAFGVVSLFLVPAIIAIFYLMSIVRSIYFAVREGISIFYLILYLCALEILPILLVVKLAIGA